MESGNPARKQIRCGVQLMVLDTASCAAARLEEQTRWKEERFVTQPPPPFFHAEMEQRGIKTMVSGNIADFKVGCKMNTASTTELRRNG